ncbi:MAG TPA: hypothetical protein VGO47_15260 [Chlamydiales bacterium]|nr:hypothetical protein [Chlamydiales bacterium]
MDSQTPYGTAGMDGRTDGKVVIDDSGNIDSLGALLELDMEIPEVDNSDENEDDQPLPGKRRCVPNKCYADSHFWEAH